jgi:hypothetical protein
MSATKNQLSTVFTAEWIQKAEKHYSHWPRPLKPLPYLIATDRQFFPIRRKVESWVADMPEAERGKMIPNLRLTDNFWHACHELVVGSFLKGLGLHVEFEKQCGKQTPDWFVSSKDGLHPFIVEVFTVNVPESTAVENKNLHDLTRRLAEIPLDFAVKISSVDNSAIQQLNPKRSKNIANSVSVWLQAYNDHSDPSLSLEGFTFTVIGRRRGYQTLQYGGPAKPIYVAWEPLRKKIEEKIHKYKTLARSNRIPLLVAVARGSETDYSNFEMKGILLGGVSAESPSTDALFAEEPLLSGAIFVTREGMAKWKVDHYPNPKATFPLPGNVLGGMSREV